MPKKTKQEIIEQLCHDIDVQNLKIKELEYEKKVLNGQIDNILDDAKRIRKEFAKAFGWYNKSNGYSVDPDPRLQSWEEIFVEVGKLKAKNNFQLLEQDIIDHQNQINSLHEKIQTKEV